MTHCPGRLFLAFWLALAYPWPAAAQNYPPTVSDATAEVFKTVDGVELNAWILFPDDHAATDSSPAVVFFFGGGWVQGTPTHFEQRRGGRQVGSALGAKSCRRVRRRSR
jgi:acetyl esterase/lipase